MRRPFSLAAVAILAAARAETAEPTAEPRVSTIYPFAGQRNSSYQAIIRGAGLEGARAVLFTEPSIRASVVRVEGVKVESEPAALHVDVSIGSGTVPGAHRFRVITPRGVSNEGTLRVVDDAVTTEERAGNPLTQFPAVINGRITQAGEIDTYWIQADEGQTLTFEAVSGHGPFDPSLSLYEPSGSWFDSAKLNRLAFLDEPLYFPGLSTDARLVHRFSRSGKYCLKLAAFSGMGGPDFTYELRIVPGETPAPSLRPTVEPAWDERRFTRLFEKDWLAKLGRRGMTEAPGAPEIYRAGGLAEVQSVTAPALIEGAIARPAEVHSVRLKVDKPQDLVLEIETPAATMPRFNPVVRVLEPGGAEIVTNVYTKLNNNGLYMMKMIQAKTAFSLHAPGEYRVEIRDITTGRAGADFHYRVLLRRKIPHIGKVEAVEDHVNLEPGRSKPVTIHVDREEDFAGFVAVIAENLPAGVSAITGIENPAEKPPLPNGGKVERYTARTQTTVLMLVAAPDATPSETPAMVRVIARPVVDGRMGDAIAVKEIPVMVVARRPS